MTVEELRVFTAAARSGSLGRASKTLALSQPSVSARLAQLERKLGVRLFERGPRGVTLTADGTRLLPYAMRCLELLEEAERVVRADDGTEDFTLALHGMFAPLFGRVVELLADRKLSIATRDAHSDQVVQLLADAEVDAGLVVDQPHPPFICLQRLFATPAVAVVGPTHPLAGERQLVVADLAQTAVAANVWGNGAERFFDLLLQAGLPRHSLRLVATAETATQLARHRDHVAVVFHVSVADDLRAGVLLPLTVMDLPAWTLELFLAYRIAERDRPEIAALRRLAIA